MVEITNVPLDLAMEIGRIGIWIQAVGLIVILWIIFQAVTLYFNRKRRLTLYSVRETLERLEKKVDRLSKKK